jgi:hypothetical protein
MADNIERSELVLDGSNKGAIKALDEVRKSQDKVGKAATKASEDARKAMRAFIKEQLGADAATKKNIISIQEMREEVERLKKAREKAAQSSKFDSGGFLGKASQAAGALGGGEVQAAISGVDDLVGFIGQLGPVSVVAAGALGATTIALQKYNETIGKGQELLRGAIAAQDAYYQLVNNGTTEDAAKTLEQAQRDLETARQQLAEIEGARDKAFIGAQRQFDDFTARFLFGVADITGAFGDLTAKEKELRESIIASELTVTRLSAGLKDNAFAFGDFRKVAEDAANKLQDAEKELATARAQAAETTKRLDEETRRLNQSYLEQGFAISARRVLQEKREKEDRAIAAERAAEDLARALERREAEHKKNMLAIQERGNKAIADAQKALADREAQAAKDIAAIRDEANRAELKAIDEFNRERARLEEDFRTAQKRALEDFKDAQADAILENDVDAFLRNRRDFRKDRKRSREDFRTEEDRATEDFEREREAERAATDARIADIQRELEEYRLATAAKIAEIQAQTAEELRLAQEAYDERLKLDTEERDILNKRADEDLKLALARRNEDQMAEDAARIRAHNEALGRIESQRVATNTALDQAIAKVNALRVAASLLTSFSSLIPGGSKSFAGGIDYVPRTMTATLHTGESVRTANQTRQDRNRRNTRPIINLNVQSQKINGVEYVTIDEVYRVVNAAVNELENDMVTALSDPKIG